MKAPKRSVLFFLLAIGIVAARMAGAASPAYRVIDLHVAGAAQSGAKSINNAGQIVGAYGPYANAGLGPTIGDQSFVLTNGTRTLLGTLGGPDSWATAISENGLVAGASQSTQHGTVKSVLYRDGSVIELGSLGGPMSLAFDVNIHGAVVGWAENALIHNRAFLYQNGSMMDLGTLGGGWSEAWGLNDLNQVVGQADTTFDYGGDPHAFLYSDGVMTDLGTLGGRYSKAEDINELGHVAGWSDLPYEGGSSVIRHAFLYTGQFLFDLGTLGGRSSQADAINNLGHVVGSSGRADGKDVPFLYSDGVMKDLTTLIDPASGWELWSAADINDLGQIVGYGRFGGAIHAFLLQPVPEPRAFCLTVAAVLLVAKDVPRVRRNRLKVSVASTNP